jgi:hypothetical protein
MNPKVNPCGQRLEIILFIFDTFLTHATTACCNQQAKPYPKNNTNAEGVTYTYSPDSIILHLAARIIQQA